MAVDGKGFVTNSDRGKEPEAWVHTTMTPDITFTWHHTIPFNCLWSIWNGLRVGEHWDALDGYMDLLGVNSLSRRTALAAMRSANPDVKIPSGIQEELLIKLTWVGWNILEGPGNEYRAEGDDPKENYDGWSGIGMTRKQKGTHLAVGALNLEMERIDKTPMPNGMSKADADKLLRAINANKLQLKGREPIRWNPKSWLESTKGQVHKQFPGVWDRKPAWKKMTVALAVENGLPVD